jgi:hypothetical protein
MYLNELNRLRESDVPDQLITKLDSYLHGASARGVWRITPGLVADETGLDLGTTQGLLLKAAQVGAIDIYYEIECPEGDSDFYVDKLENVDWGEERQCRACYVSYQPSPDNVWVVFGIKGTPDPKVPRRLRR